MKTRIHVNQHKIRSNKKNNLNEPVITVKTSKSNTYANEVKIKGPSKSYLIVLINHFHVELKFGLKPNSEVVVL